MLISILLNKPAGYLERKCAARLELDRQPAQSGAHNYRKAYGSEAPNPRRCDCPPPIPLPVGTIISTRINTGTLGRGHRFNQGPERTHTHPFPHGGWGFRF